MTEVLPAISVPVISVPLRIVPTRNAPPTLGRTLAHLANQTLPPNLYEVIVVTGGVVDDVWRRACTPNRAKWIRQLRCAYCRSRDRAQRDGATPERPRPVATSWCSWTTIWQLSLNCCRHTCRRMLGERLSAW